MINNPLQGAHAGGVINPSINMIGRIILWIGKLAHRGMADEPSQPKSPACLDHSS